MTQNFIVTKFKAEFVDKLKSLGFCREGIEFERKLIEGYELQVGGPGGCNVIFGISFEGNLVIDSWDMDESNHIFNDSGFVMDLLSNIDSLVADFKTANPNVFLDLMSNKQCQNRNKMRVC